MVDTRSKRAGDADALPAEGAIGAGFTPGQHAEYDQSHVRQIRSVQQAGFQNAKAPVFLVEEILNREKKKNRCTIVSVA